MATTIRIVPLLLACAALPCRLPAQATPADSNAVGPARGWLVLEGGGRLGGTEIATRFVELAGGPSRRYVAITTAVADSQFTRERIARCEERTAQIFGVAKVTCLDARDRDEANSPRFLGALRGADAVWIYGGDEERLVDRYVGTQVVGALREVLDRGGVLGGTSAGAMILAGYVWMRAAQSVSAFEFLPHTAIAPHFTQRRYEPALRKLRSERPDLRGIGIDESTAIVVHGGRFDVIGEGAVTVLGRHAAVLHRGGVFDLAADSAVTGG